MIDGIFGRGAIAKRESRQACRVQFGLVRVLAGSRWLT